MEVFEQFKEKFLVKAGIDQNYKFSIRASENELEEWFDSNQVQAGVKPACVNCKYYKKIDDTEVQNKETFWEQCDYKDINEMLVWDCEKIGCTEFVSKSV